MSGYISGYEEVRVESMTWPLNGHLQQFDIIMLPTGEQHGELVLETRGQPPKGFLVGKQVVPSCRLQLYSSTRQAALNFCLKDWPEATALKQVPCGVYSASIALNNGLLTCGPSDGSMESVTISKELSHVVVDVSEMSALQVEILSGAGGYDGTVLFNMAPTSSPNAVFISFASAPYGILGISPGDYDVRFVRPFETPGDLPEHVRIVAGETAKLTVTVPPHR